LPEQCFRGFIVYRKSDKTIKLKMIKYISKIRVEWEYFKIYWGKWINVGVEKKISLSHLFIEEGGFRSFLV
jgi:hypothetical protein